MRVAHVISCLRNAGLAKTLFAHVPLSNFTLKFLRVLYDEGFIEGYQVVPYSYQIKVYLVYIRDDFSLVSALKPGSKPSLYEYLTYKDLVQQYSGKFVIISSSFGMMTGTEAFRYRTGGVLICSREYF